MNNIEQGHDLTGVSVVRLCAEHASRNDIADMYRNKRHGIYAASSQAVAAVEAELSQAQSGTPPAPPTPPSLAGAAAAAAAGAGGGVPGCSPLAPVNVPGRSASASLPHDYQQGARNMDLTSTAVQFPDLHLMLQNKVRDWRSSFSGP